MRGILVFVLNQRTGVPMAVRAFDTYASKEEGGAMIKFIEELQDGRIVCMAIKVVYIEDITRWREDMNFMFEWQEQYLRSERSERVRYCSC